MLDLVTSPSVTVNREQPDSLKLNLSNTYATVPDDIEGKPMVLGHGWLISGAFLSWWGGLV